MALDLGAARVGVAVDDELGLYAHPRGVLDARQRQEWVRQVGALVQEEGIRRILIGLPLDMKGGEGDAARKARALARTIAETTRCDVLLVDERLSTVQARQQLAASEVHGRKAKERIDEASACVLLQAFLDGEGARRRSRRPRDEAEGA